MMNARNFSAGFSMVEVLIAAGLLSTAVFGVSAIFSYLESAKSGAMSRSLQIQMQSQIMQSLSSPADCIKNLVNHVQGPNSGPANISIPSTQTYDLYQTDTTTASATPVFTSGQFYQGSNFSITLEFPNPNPFENVQAGVERPLPTRRYLANIVINKTKAKNSNSMSAPLSLSRVPILIELDSSNNLFSCTTRSENAEDSLYSVAGRTTHSIRDCYKIGGIPYPSSLGLICRTPLGAVNKVVGGPRAVQPPLNCPTGWNVAKIGLLPLTTTLIRDLNLTPAQCVTRPSKCQTGWHSMAAVDAAKEWCQAEGDSGANGSTSSFPVLGATVAGFATYAYILNMAVLPAALAGTALGSALVSAGTVLLSNPIGWAVLAVVVIFAIFGGSGGSCAPAVYPVQYSQPLAIGCF